MNMDEQVETVMINGELVWDHGHTLSDGINKLKNTYADELQWVPYECNIMYKVPWPYTCHFSLLFLE